jgi:hypothetical protein
MRCKRKIPPGDWGIFVRMESELSVSKYFSAGKQSLIGTERWDGDVVFGSDAIYLFQSRKIVFRRSLTMLEKLADRVLTVKGIEGRDSKKIPPAVRNDPDWPVEKGDRCPVVTVPRNAIEFLYHKKLSGKLQLIYDGMTLVIPHDQADGKNLKAFLTATGWPMIWDGEAVNLSPEQATACQEKIKAGMFHASGLSVLIFTTGVVLCMLPVLLMMSNLLHPPFAGVALILGWGLGLLSVGFAAVAWSRGL